MSQARDITLGPNAPQRAGEVFGELRSACAQRAWGRVGECARWMLLHAPPDVALVALRYALRVVPPHAAHARVWRAWEALLRRDLQAVTAPERGGATFRIAPPLLDALHDGELRWEPSEGEDQASHDAGK